MDKPKVLVVGSINYDLIFSAPVGKEMVLNGCLVFNEMGTFLGGKGSNQAVALRKLGADVSLVGAVGNDDIGSQIIKELEKNGVNIENVVRIGDVSTGTSAIFNMDSRGYYGTNVLGANSRLLPDLVETAFEREL